MGALTFDKHKQHGYLPIWTLPNALPQGMQNVAKCCNALSYIL